IRHDLDECAERELSVKSGNVIRFHSNAPITGRPADDFLLRRAVNVNAAIKSVRIAGFETSQPDDPGDDRVPTGCIGSENLAGPAALVKNSAERGMIANFLRDLKSTKRRGQASPAVAQTVFGGGNRIGRERGTVLHQHKFLIADANNHAVGPFELGKSA